MYIFFVRKIITSMTAKGDLKFIWYRMCCHLWVSIVLTATSVIKWQSLEETVVIYSSFGSLTGETHTVNLSQIDLSLWTCEIWNLNLPMCHQLNYSLYWAVHIFSPVLKKKKPVVSHVNSAWPGFDWIIQLPRPGFGSWYSGRNLS